jgi:heptosyltransferase-3
MKIVSPPAPPKRVLLVCTRRIGDVLLATPLARSLKQGWPGTRLDMLVFRGTESVLEGNPDIDAVIAVPARARLGEKLSQLRRLWRSYDLAVSPIASDRARLYCWIAGRYRLGLINPEADSRIWKLLLNDWLAFDDLNTHTVSMGLQLAERVGVTRRREVIAPTPSDHPERITELLAPLNSAPFAVIHPYPKFRYKMWRPEAWMELAQWLLARRIGVVLTGGPDGDEVAYVQAIARQLSGAVVDLAGSLRLAETAAVIRQSCLFVGPDTVVTHIAAATGTPTIALFGPSNPVKWGPWPKDWNHDESPWPWRGGGRQGNVIMIQGPGDCVPCRLEGCDRHIDSDSECLQNIRVATVIGAAETLLGQANA